MYMKIYVCILMHACVYMGTCVYALVYMCICVHACPTPPTRAGFDTKSVFKWFEFRVFFFLDRLTYPAERAQFSQRFIHERNS